MKFKLDCIGLFVKDMSKMVTFYRDVMKMETQWNGEENADLISNGARIIMYGRDDFEKMTGTSFTYPEGLNGTMEIAFEAGSYDLVDEEFIRVVELGAKPIMEPKTMPWGQRTSYVADPEGNLIEIASFNELELSDDDLENENDLYSIDLDEYI